MPSSVVTVSSSSSSSGATSPSSSSTTSSGRRYVNTPYNPRQSRVYFGRVQQQQQLITKIQQQEEQQKDYRTDADCFLPCDEQETSQEQQQVFQYQGSTSTGTTTFNSQQCDDDDDCETMSMVSAYTAVTTATNTGATSTTARTVMGSSFANSFPSTPEKRNFSQQQHTTRMMIPAPASSFTNTPSCQLLCDEANKYNIHSSVLSDVLKLTTVPFCNGTSPYNMSITNDITTTNAIADETTILFVGHLPLVIPSTNVIALLIKSLTGITPLRISMTKSGGRTSQGRLTSPLAVVEVYKHEAPIVIANLHRRVLFDQTAFHVATKTEDIMALNQYCKMLETNQDIRFQHRCYSTVTVIETGRPGDKAARTRRDRRDAYNPLCQCSECQTFLHTHSDFSFLHKHYLPHVVSTAVATAVQEGRSTLFCGEKLLLTHAYLIKEYLPTYLQGLYCDVSDKARLRCSRNAHENWLASYSHFIHEDLLEEAHWHEVIVNNDRYQQQQQQQLHQQ